MNKEQLEKEKLKLEIERLKIPFWKNLEFWKVFIPTLAVLISLYYTFGRGILDSDKSKLELQKEQLKLDIALFEKRKTEIEDTTRIKDKEKTKIIEELQHLTLSKDSLLKQIINYKKLFSTLKAENFKIKSASIKDKSFYTSELKKQYNLEKEYESNLSKLKSENQNRQVRQAQLEAQLAYLLTKTKLTDMEKLDYDIVQNDAAIKEYDKLRKEQDKEMERIHKKYEEKKKRVETMTTEELIREFELIFLRESK